LPDFTDATAPEILHWALHTYHQNFAIATSFQKEGMVIVDLASRISKDVRVFTLDTGRLPDETYQMMQLVRQRYGIQVEIVFPDRAEVEQLVTLHGPNLFYESVPGRERCCDIRKVRPLERKLATLQAWATGLRREQSATRAATPKVEERDGRVKLNPLADWTAAQVDGYIRTHNVPLHPLYAKACELDIPVRIYSSMNYATDRPYDLGHPRHLDQVAIDFPELTIIGGLGGWPWVNEMVALVRRHPKLHLDTSAHRARYLGQRGSGWEMLLQFGNTLIQDKVLVGLSAGLVGQSHETLIKEYLDLPLKDTVKEKWLYNNAARIFGLS
jgi:phosphoadenylyl-sulfate reductase (thioredoxin)